MTRVTARARYSYEEYRRFEETTDAKHEFIDGEILAMAGGTPEHAALAAALIAEVSPQLAGKPCTTFTSDLRVRVRATGLATYPDVTVICGDLSRDPDDTNAANNPTVIIEVLSDSTADYDAGEKFVHYAQIDALRDYVLVSHAGRRIELRTRQPTGLWQATAYGRGETLRIASIDVTLHTDAIYERSPLTSEL